VAQSVESREAAGPAQALSLAGREQAERSLGYHDPCWCDSEKKHRQSHMGQDQLSRGRPAVQQGQAGSSGASESFGMRQCRRRQ
jgi:hypothetical protein